MLLTLAQQELSRKQIFLSTSVVSWTERKVRQFSCRTVSLPFLDNVLAHLKAQFAGVRPWATSSLQTVDSKGAVRVVWDTSESIRSLQQRIDLSFVGASAAQDVLRAILSV